MSPIQSRAALALGALLLLMCCVPALSSCGGGDDGGCLDVELLSSNVSDEGLVSLFFRVECNGRSLSTLQSTDFEVLENGYPLSSFESALRVSTQTDSDGTFLRANTLLLLDMSGSIVSSGSLPTLIEAAKAFITRTVRAGQPAAVFVFDGRSYIEEIVDFSEDPDVLEAGLDSLLNYEFKDQSTNLNGAIVNGLERLKVVRDNTADVMMSTSTLVVFTDGTDRANRVTPLEAQQAVADAVKAGISVYTIGLGVEVNPDELEALGLSGSQTAESTDAIVEAFTRIADTIDNLGRGNYGLVYCSSARGGEQELTVRITYAGEVVVMGTSYVAENIGTGCLVDDGTTDDGTTTDGGTTDGTTTDGGTTDGTTDGTTTDGGTTDGTTTDGGTTDGTTTDGTATDGTTP